MGRIAAVLVGVVGLTTVGHGTAQAAPPGRVEVSFRWTAHNAVGPGYVASAGCQAVATGTEPEVVAVVTEVTCTIGAASRSGALPGAYAVSEVVAATEAPIVYCVTGRAIFLDPTTNDLFLVSAGPSCVTFSG